MPAEFFLDTSVFVYTFDRHEPDKQARARRLVERALGTGDGVVSSQVLQEFLNVALQKFERPLSEEQALRYLREVLDPLCMVFPSISLYETVRHQLLELTSLDEIQEIAARPPRRGRP